MALSYSVLLTSLIISGLSLLSIVLLVIEIILRYRVNHDIPLARVLLLLCISDGILPVSSLVLFLTGDKDHLSCMIDAALRQVYNFQITNAKTAFLQILPLVSMLQNSYLSLWLFYVIGAFVGVAPPHLLIAALHRPPPSMWVDFGCCGCFWVMSTLVFVVLHYMRQIGWAGEWCWIIPDHWWVGLVCSCAPRRMPIDVFLSACEDCVLCRVMCNHLDLH